MLSSSVAGVKRLAKPASFDAVCLSAESKRSRGDSALDVAARSASPDLASALAFAARERVADVLSRELGSAPADARVPSPSALPCHLLGSSALASLDLGVADGALRISCVDTRPVGIYLGRIRRVSSSDKSYIGLITYYLDLDGCLLGDGVPIVLDAKYLPAGVPKNHSCATIRADLYSAITDKVREDLLADVFVKNTFLFDAIRKDIESGFLVRVACASRRQDMNTDLRNAIRFVDGSWRYFGSVFDVVDAISAHFNVEHDTALLTDVMDCKIGVRKDSTVEFCEFSDHELGVTYCRGEAALRGDFTFFADKFADLASSEALMGIPNLSISFDDESKVLHILSHVYANFYSAGSLPFVCKFFDDRDVIIRRALDFLSTYPYLLPAGVELRMYSYVCATAASSGFCEETSLVIKGSGDSEQALNYKQFIRELALESCRHGFSFVASPDISKLSRSHVQSAMHRVGWKVPSSCSLTSTSSVVFVPLPPPLRPVRYVASAVLR